MANEPLTAKSALTKIADQLRDLFRRDPLEILAQADGKVAVVQRATDVLDSHIPFFFEAFGLTRGTESPTGTVVHKYDKDGRLLVIEKPKKKFPDVIKRTVFEYHNDECRYSVIGTDRQRRSEIERVGTVGHLNGDLHFDVSSDLYRSVAYIWKLEDGLPTVLQVWDLRDDQPYAVTPFRDAEGRLTKLVRSDDEVVWQSTPRPSKKNRLSAREMNDLAKRFLEVLERHASNDTADVLLYTVCFELNNAAYLPPQIGVVFEPDAEVFARKKEAYDDGAGALLNPTLQEDYDFPQHAEYPFVAITAHEGLDFDWEEASLRDNAIRLVDALNAVRAPGSPPFLLVDLEGDPSEFVSRLDPADRKRLGRYGLA